MQIACHYPFYFPNTESEQATLFIKGILLVTLIVVIPFTINLYISWKLKRIANDIANIEDNAVLAHYSPIVELQNTYANLTQIKCKLKECQALKNNLQLQNKLVIDHINQIVIGINRQFDIIVWNKKASKTFGVTCDEAQHKSLLEFIPNDLVAFHITTINKFFDSNTPDDKYLIKNKSIEVTIGGQKLMVNLSVCLIHDNLLVAFIKDMSKEYEQEYYYNASLSIIEESDVVVMTIEITHFEIAFISNSVEHLLGFPRQAFIINQKSLADILTQTQVLQFKQCVDHFSCRNITTTRIVDKFTFIDANGEPIYTSVAFYPLRDKHGLPRHVQCIIKNITAEVVYQNLIQKYNDDLQVDVQAKTLEIMQLNDKLSAMNDLLIRSQQLANENMKMLARE
jgi:PAS domain S-box-containing protein